MCALCALALAEQLTRTGCRAAGVGGGVGGRKGLSLGDSSKLTGSLPATIEQTGWEYSPPLVAVEFCTLTLSNNFPSFQNYQIVAHDTKLCHSHKSSNNIVTFVAKDEVL